MKKTFVLFLAFLPLFSLAQTHTFTRQDSLRGSITPERAWWDLVYYDLQLEPDIPAQSLKGINTIVFRKLKEGRTLQLDLQPPMHIDRVLQNGKKLSFEREGNVYRIMTQKTRDSLGKITVFFSGKPPVSRNPPWSGGITWKTDTSGQPFVATSCQGDGASLWWPCKDHAYDEPDSMQIRITVPKGLTAVSNGRLRRTEMTDSSAAYTWFVSNPINNYGVNMNIAAYAHFSEKYAGKKGELTCDYYVLPEHFERAVQQFKQVKLTLDAFEHHFGPYPFYEDGYKLVEVPYLGMEHQSSVTYGNGYQNGYRGRDLSGTGHGLLFDFIIVHESGHEWFANNITCRDIADMWIHESFTSYSESIFLEYHYGKKTAAEYLRGIRKNIKNDRPVIGSYDVNHSGSGDMYYKGANMLHTLRQIVDNDSLWFSLLRDMNTAFYHQTVNSDQIEGYMERKTGKKLKAFFDQYLRDTRIPRLEYQCTGTSFTYRWANCSDDFDMPVKVYLNGVPHWLFPTVNWQTDKTVSCDVVIDPDFYVTF